jgi:hypothetical protein
MNADMLKRGTEAPPPPPSLFKGGGGGERPLRPPLDPPLHMEDREYSLD